MNDKQTQFDSQREELVTQIRREGVDDALVLNAMRLVPREKYVPKHLQEFAYDNCPLPIGTGQTISQPLIVAMMAAALQLEPGDRVLEIGTGSGYAAAVLAKVVFQVYTVERHRELAENARQRFREQGFKNLHVKIGDGTLGWPENAPFDAIAVTAGAPEVPQPLLDQLRVGGRLVIPVGHDRMSQQLVRVCKQGVSEYRSEPLADVRFVPLIGAGGWA